MKSNEAPDKIYLEWYHVGDEKYREWVITPKTNNESIEYTRTDALIEKATEWLKKNADNYTWYDEMEGESGMIDEFIEDFKNYMKGE